MHRICISLPFIHTAIENGQSVKGILTLRKLMPVYTSTVKAEDRKLDTNLRPLNHNDAPTSIENIDGNFLTSGRHALIIIIYTIHVIL